MQGLGMLLGRQLMVQTTGLLVCVGGEMSVWIADESCCVGIQYANAVGSVA